MKDKYLSYIWGSIAILAGTVIIYVGEHLMGIQLALFWGIQTFSPAWVFTLTVIPLIAGFVVSMIYGLGGKLLCYFPALFAQAYSYWELLYVSGVPEEARLLPLGFWGFVVIVVIECAAIGGVLGEVMVKKIYGRRPKHLLYKSVSAEVERKAD